MTTIETDRSSAAVQQREPALEAEGISLSFGGVVALSDVSFSVTAGETFAVIGPNGAGKSSLLNCLAGTYRPQRGSARFRGAELLGRRPAAIVRNGIARTFQNLGVVGSLTVLDNVLLGRHTHLTGGFVASAFGLPWQLRSERRARAWCEELLRRLGLFEKRHVPVAALPYGLQKRVDLGRALAVSPSLLILDEPVAGMSSDERLEIAQLLRQLRHVTENESLSMIVVEHDMDLVMGLAETVMVIDFGRVIATGPPALIRRNPQVLRAYLGQKASTAAGAEGPP